MTTVFWGSVGLILYYLLGYPLLLMVWSRVVWRPVGYAAIVPSVTVVIAAHNEDKVIEDKIRNTLAQDYQRGQIQIIVSSDGSRDRTVERADALLPKGVVITTARRHGKTNAINRAMERAEGEIVVFTDANVTLKPDALTKLVRNFADPTVGCVAGRLFAVNTDESQTSASAGVYWSWENFIKLKESGTGSIMGADGSLFAIRRQLFRVLPLYTIDDFGTSIGILARGGRVVFEPDAIAYERASICATEEFRRKVRIATRTVGTLLYLRPSLSGLLAGDMLKLFSHILLRYGSGYLMLGALLSNVWLAATEIGQLYGFLLGGQLGFYVLGLTGATAKRAQRRVRWLGMIHYFIMMNIAALVGSARALSGYRMPYWKSPESTR